MRAQETRRLGGDLYTDVWRLEKLTLPQIEKACRSYDPEIASGITESAESNTDFMEIVSRPSMLPVVATIWGEVNELRSEGNQLTGAALIEKYIQAVFARKEAELERDQKKLDAPTGSRYLALPKQVREFLTICVAWRMSGLRLKNTIPRSEISEMVREIYDTLVKVPKSSGVTPGIAEGMIDFEQRYKDESQAERIEAIAAEIASAGLLIPDPAGGASNLRFPHKQFFEFLIAKAIAIRSEPGLQGAQQILERCSPGMGVSARLNNEPNAVGYLAECIGLNLETISTRWQRFSLRLHLTQLLAAYRFLGLFFPNFMKRNDKLFTEDGNLSVPNMKSVWILENLSRLVIMSSGPIMLFWMMAFVGISFSEIFSGTFLEPIVHLPLTVFDDVAVNAGVEGSEIGSITRLFASIFSGMMVAATANATMKLMNDNSFSKMFFSFLHTHWKKSDGFPKSRIEQLNMAMTSLSRGRVQLKTSQEDTTDYTRFLYPANELGGGLASRKAP